MKKLKSLIFLLLAPGFMVSTFEQIVTKLGASPFAGALFGIVLLLATIFAGKPVQGNVFSAGVQKEIWTNHILGNLFKDNEFLEYSFNADQYVLQGKVVHIPQANSPSTVVKNRNSFPATVTRRTDSDVTYALDEYTTDPRCIPHADTVELSYDKRESVLTEDQMALKETVAENMLINWAPSVAGSIYRTTGGDVAATAPSAIGNRKLITPADFRTIMKIFNRWNISRSDRYALLSAEMYDQLIQQLDDTQYRDFSRYVDAEKGILGMLWSFKILVRSSVLVFDNAGTPAVKPYGAAGAAADNEAALFWHKNYVERALGEMVMFDQENSPQHYGDIYSFLLRMGGRVRRVDQKGVLACVQAAGS